MNRIRDTKWGKRVGGVLYYAFLILTVGAFLVFIPLHSGLVKSNGDDASNPSSNKMVTHRDTNGTGETEVVLVAPRATDFVYWIEEFQILGHKGE